MPYDITYTESLNTLKPAITVVDGTLDNSTSLTFVGKNYAGYGRYIANDFLHLLENFANPASPIHPIQGQLWFDNSTNQLMVNNDGTADSWTAVGFVQKSISSPASPNLGDIWVDTIDQQLKIFVGGTWTLVGPLYKAGSITGQATDSITDTLRPPITHDIISLYSSNNRVAIISTDSFTPQIGIPGFSSIKRGITLSSIKKTINGVQVPYKFTGICTQSDDSTKLGGQPSTNYVRTDTTNILSETIYVPSIYTGSDNNFRLLSDPALTTNFLIESVKSGNSLEIRNTDTGGNIHSVAYFSPSQRVGIATISPASTLDVNGTITISATSGILNVTSSADVSNTGAQTASIQTNGGLYVNQSATIGSTITVKNGVLILNLLSSSLPTHGSVILPGYQTHTLTGGIYTPSIATPPLYDIGSVTSRFRNLYVENFVGNITGTVTGDVSGNVAGSAGYLKNPTIFSITGAITSDNVTFNGNGNAVTFNTTLDPTLIGSIILYAGSVPPSGYLFCDGMSTYLVETYQALSSLLGTMSGSTFTVPHIAGPITGISYIIYSGVII